jgi:superfamily II DNA or RNA helicase
VDNPRSLRKWQAEALDLLRAWLAEPTKRVVVRAIMGAGKSEVIKRLAQIESGPVVVATSRVRLVEQLKQQLGAGAYYGREKAVGRITVTTYDSLANLEMPGSLLICDECHRTDNPRMAKALSAIKPRAMVGFTATPARLATWDEIIYDYSAQQALHDGVVVPWVSHAWVSDSMMPTPLDDACEAMAMRAIKHGPTLINAISIDDAEAFAGRLTRAGVHSLAIHSRNTPPMNAAALERMRRGEVLGVHVDMLSEGVDFPWLRCLVLRRPTASRVRFAQEVGRVLRAHPGKADAHIYDPLGLLHAHRLDFAACFASEHAATDEDEQKRAEKAAKREVLRYVQSHTAMAALAQMARLSWQQVGSWPDNAIKTTQWRSLDATDKQVAHLQRMAWVGKMRQAPELIDWQRKALRAVIDYAAGPRHYSRGEVSDLCGLLHVVADNKRLFPEQAEPTLQEIAEVLRGTLTECN